METSQRVVVAMSGGVDSSVAAALLVRQGYQVIGMMMRLWSEPGHENDNRCCTPDAMMMARRVASRLGIQFYSIDAQEIFRNTVVAEFINGHLRGVTPNPCLLCNKMVRWEFLLNRARSVGADYMATGHYVRLETDDLGKFHLRRAIDPNKDQSYVLHMLDQTKLSQALFPLGPFTKPEVRQLAREFNLPVAERSESQDLCFLGNQDYRDFLSRIAPQTRNPGPIVDTSGNYIGEHQGLAFYTIGQRKGLGVTSPTPLYVISKEISGNRLVVGDQHELGQDRLVVGKVNWISGTTPESSFRAQVKIRYKAPAVWATIYPQLSGQIEIHFDKRIRDITPGQAAVIYDDEDCLGGGLIQAEGVSG